MTGVNARIQNSSVVFHEQSSQVMNMSTKPTYKELEQRVQELEQSESERKKTGELLWQQKEIFSLLVNYSSDILVLIDKNGEQKFISPSAEKITGYTVGELQRPFAEIIHPEDLHQVERGFEELLNNPEAVVTVNYRHKHKDGVQRQLHLPIDDNYTYPFLATIKILPRVLNLGMEVLRHPCFQRSFFYSF